MIYYVLGAHLKKGCFCRSQLFNMTSTKVIAAIVIPILASIFTAKVWSGILSSGLSFDVYVRLTMTFQGPSIDSWVLALQERTFTSSMNSFQRL